MKARGNAPGGERVELVLERIPPDPLEQHQQQGTLTRRYRVTVLTSLPRNLVVSEYSLWLHFRETTD